MTQKKRILISGAGIAGLLTYIRLDRKKYEVTLIEKGEDFRSVGYAITLWNSGFELLKKMVLHDRIEYLQWFTKLGKTRLLNEQIFPESLYSFRNLGYIVDREDLIGILIAEAKSISGTILTNTYIQNVSQESDGKHRVTFNSGNTDVYDLVVICEGIHSSTRDICFENAKVTDSEYAVEYVEADRMRALEKENVIFSNANFTGVIMTSPRSTVIAHFLRKGQSHYEENKGALRESLQRMLVQLYGPTAVPNYFGNAKVFDLKDVYVTDFHTGHIVLVGDAAHGRVPVLGLGTTLAIEDTFFLTYLLNELPLEEWTSAISTVLGEYSKIREKRSQDLYAIQDAASRSSLPRKHPGPEKAYTARAKVLARFLGIITNRIFVLIFGRAITYDIQKDAEKSVAKFA